MATADQARVVYCTHLDRVLALSYDYYGNRLATASADQHLKVFEQKHGGWELIDAWRAHDGEITDIKWNGPLAGSTLGSIGEDCTFKLWQENVAQALQSGRRYKLIQGPWPSKSALPWVSLDFRNVGKETYLALISHDGNFAIMEPKDHDDLSGEWIDWMENREFWIDEMVPHRSQDTNYRLAFHQDKLPNWSGFGAGCERRSIAIAIAGVNSVRVFRTDADRHLHLIAEMRNAPHATRDIAWANGSIRGSDIIATADKDNVIRLYELEIESANSGWRDARTLGEDIHYGPHSDVRRFASGIGVRLAAKIPTKEQRAGVEDCRENTKQHLRMIAELPTANSNIRRVYFSAAGDVLVSSGDDGAIRIFKRGVDGKWRQRSMLTFSSSSTRVT